MNKHELVELITKAYIAIVQMIYVRFGEDLSDYELCFDVEKNGSYAECNAPDKKITFFVLGSRNELHCPKYIKNFTLECIIHELTHAICDRYDLDLGDNNKYFMMFRDAHNIPFALVCYCLQREILGKRWEFYREYDFHEEEGIENLELDDFKISRLIRRMRFETVSDLAEQAKEMAHYVRVKILKTKTVAEQ